MKNIALYFYSISSSGGAERMICWLANGLSRCDFKVHLITLDKVGVSSFYSLDDSVSWLKLGVNPGLYDKFRRVRGLSNYLKDNHIYSLIGFVVSADKTVYAAAQLAHVKLIVAERNAPSMYDLRYSQWQKRIIFTLLRFSDSITTQSPSFIQSYPSYLRDKIVSIPNPVYPLERHARPDLAANGRFVLLAVSRLDEFQKSLLCLIDAFYQVSKAHEDWDLVVVGSGQDEALYRKRINDYQLDDRIKIFSEEKNVKKYYESSHLFVLPSRWEGFPNALAEALSAGLPAIGFEQANGVCDLISSETGWLAAGNKNTKSLALTLDIAMQDPVGRRYRGQNAISFIEQFKPDMQLRKWTELINNLSRKS